jgi:hypothetical protein
MFDSTYFEKRYIFVFAKIVKPSFGFKREGIKLMGLHGNPSKTNVNMA